jgi:hypothetical protein
MKSNFKFAILAIFLCFSLSGCGSSGSDTGESSEQTKSSSNSGLLTEDNCIDIALYALVGMELAAKANTWLGNPTDSPSLGSTAYFLVGYKGRRIGDQVNSLISGSALSGSNIGEDLRKMAEAHDLIMTAWESENMNGLEPTLQTLGSISMKLNNFSQSCIG